MQKLSMSKKGQIGSIQSLIMTIAGVAVMLAVVFIVLDELQGSTTAGSMAYNSTGTIIDKLGTVPNWVGIIIIVALAFIVLSFFYAGRAE